MKHYHDGILHHYPKGFHTYERKTYKKARFRKARNRNLHMRWKLQWVGIITWEDYKTGMNRMNQPNFPLI